MINKNILLALLLLGNSIIAFSSSVKQPLHQVLDVQSQILSNASGYLIYPYHWLYAHIECTVTNSQSNDLFIVSTLEGGDGEDFKNMRVDGVSMGNKDYFALTQVGTHNFEFDFQTSENEAPPESLTIYNGSTEPLNFSNCIATSE